MRKLHNQSGPAGRRRVVIGDSWFAGVATAVALDKVCLYFVGPVKTNEKDYPYEDLDPLVGEDRGSSAAMHATISGVTLLAAGWRRRKAYTKRGKAVSGIYHMISTCSSVSPGPSAKFKRHSKDGKRVRDYEVVRPMVFFLYHAIMPMVDQHNARRQGYLALERAFATRSAWLRFFCSWFGVIVINAFLLCNFFADLSNPLKVMPQREWVKKLAIEMMAYHGKVTAAEAAASSSAAAAAAEVTSAEPFGFVKSGTQLRCKAAGCGDKTYVQCANCVASDPNGAQSYAFCAVYFAQKKRGEGNEPPKKKGCMALHAASCPHSKHAAGATDGSRRHSTENM